MFTHVNNHQKSPTYIKTWFVGMSMRYWCLGEGGQLEQSSITTKSI